MVDDRVLGGRGGAAVRAQGNQKEFERQIEIKERISAGNYDTSDLPIAGEDLREEDKESSAGIFQDQCFLMANWEKLARANLEASGLSLEQTQPRSYSNFMTIDHPRPYEFLNRMFMKHKNGDSLLRLTSAQLSYLVPYVRLYKIYKNPTNPAQEECIELPFDDITSRSKISNLMKSGAGRGGGVGLKSFDWVSMGDHPGTKYMYRATLKIFLQSIEELFEVRDVRQIFGNKTVGAKWSDLVIVRPSLRKGANEGPNVWDSDYYQVRAIVGWSVYTESKEAKKLFTKEQIDALKNTKLIFNLNLQSHGFDFNDDGSVVMTAEYITSSESVMDSPSQNESNVLRSPNSQQIERREKRLNLLEKKLEELGDKKEEDDGDEKNKLKVGIKEEIEILRSQIEEFVVQDKTQLYRSIIQTMYEQGDIKYVNVPSEYLTKRKDLKSNDGDRSLQATRFEESVTRSRDMKNVELSVQPVSIFQNRTLSKIDLVERTNPEGGKQLGFDIDQAMDSIQELDGDAPPPPESERVYFFYLGALLDAVLDGMFKKSVNGPIGGWENKKLRIICGPLTFYDYGNPEYVGMVTKKKGVSVDGEEVEERWRGRMSDINLVDIPISLKEWTAFFNNFISDKGRTRLSFKTFLDEVIQDIFVSAVNTQCVEFAPQQAARLKYRAFSAPRVAARDELFAEQSRRELDGFIDEYPYVFKNIKNEVCSSDADDYLLIYGSENRPYDLKSDIEKDAKIGVYHLFYGNEIGLVKKIKFKKTDIPGLEESNMYNASQEGWKPGKVLRRRYDADIDMIGNTLFEPGQYIHIVPSLGGSGNLTTRVKQIKELGIGGYFQVLHIKSGISSGVFSTDLETKWHSTGDGTLNHLDQQVGDIVIRGATRIGSGRAPDQKTGGTQIFYDEITTTRKSFGGGKSSGKSGAGRGW